MMDESVYFELLIANERIGSLVDVLADPYQRSRHQHALRQLQQELQRGQSYVEEATRLGVVPVLTRLLATSSDEPKLDRLSSMIALCSGPMACSGRSTSYSYGPVTLHIREGALGDGLGAKVWSVCHIMARELLAFPGIVGGQEVLELGSGTGIIGMLAALSGAAQVFLTDNESKVLANLRTCMHMNTAAAARAAAASLAGASSSCSKTTLQGHAAEDEQHQQQQQQQQPSSLPSSLSPPPQQQQQAAGNAAVTDAELFDDAESVDDFDLGELAAGQAAAAAGAGGGAMAANGCSHGNGGSSSSSSDHDLQAALVRHATQQSAWEADNMVVRTMEWQESLDMLEADEQARGAQRAPGEQQQQQQAKPHAQIVSTSSSSGPPEQPPGLPLDRRFRIILGNEVMYEEQHARLVAAAIRHRLSKGGRALLCCAVRELCVFQAFSAACSRWGLRYRARGVQPSDAREQAYRGGIEMRPEHYEGGFLLMAVDHRDAPAPDWYRDDWQDM